MSLLEQRSFIQRIPPFDNLTDRELSKLTEKLDIVYFKANETLDPLGHLQNYLYSRID